MDALWDAILDLTARFVIPDWGAAINLIPALLLLVVVLFVAWTGWRFATAGPTRRGPGRLPPVPPPGVHASAPSFAPVVVAIGAFLLFFGLVVGGWSLWLGLAALALSLLYWGREALADYDHLVHREPLPAVAHEGPPPGVHLPGPTFRPILASLAMALLFLGLVFGGAILAVGVIFVVVTLLGWLNDARSEYVKTVEADRTGHLENLPPPAWPRRLLVGFTVLTAIAVAINLGVLFAPPSETAGGGPGGGPGASPGAPAGCEEPAAEQELVARDIAFDQRELCVPSGEPFTVHLVNEDSPGIPHDVDIRSSGGDVLVDRTEIDGGTEETYEYEALEPGEYVFICSIHPVASMTGTLVVR